MALLIVKHPMICMAFLVNFKSEVIFIDHIVLSFPLPRKHSSFAMFDPFPSLGFEPEVALPNVS